MAFGSLYIMFSSSVMIPLLHLVRDVGVRTPVSMQETERSARDRESEELIVWTRANQP